MNDNTIRFNSGKWDGVNSASFVNYIHNNWTKDKWGKLVHFDKSYLKGYMEGFESAAGFRPMSFPT